MPSSAPPLAPSPARTEPGPGLLTAALVPWRAAWSLLRPLAQLPVRPRSPRSPSLSDDAAVLIRSLLAAEDMPPTAGVRLSVDEAVGALQMCLAPHPQDQDVVVRHRDAAMFLSPVAAQRLATRTLHAALEPRRCFYTD